MKNYLKHHPWQIVEDGFHHDFHQVSESIFSLGNGRMGTRGNFEEDYSGETLRGSYFAGVYYPDLTRVGWWKNGYPEYFAKVLNGVNWIGIRIHVDDMALDLAIVPVAKFKRVLDMENGLLLRTFELSPASGGTLKFQFERFCNMADPDTAAIQVKIKSEGFFGEISFEPYLDFDVHNKDSNYGDQFWVRRSEYQDKTISMVSAITKKTSFSVSSFMQTSLHKNDVLTEPNFFSNEKMKASYFYRQEVKAGDTLVLTKYVANLSSLYIPADEQLDAGKIKIQALFNTGYDTLKAAHVKAWAKIWDGADVEITGDISAQQGIRFNIFHLWQTYTGEDDRLNIGPKGFTGEKYGGSTYWDTEAYCVPFYLSSSESRVARNLLVYRYLHLPKAIKNAEKLGFANGAALYPMVTINGEECHNEWEITFEEIHRNGAIIYAIYDYIRYTGDMHYMVEGGLEVIIAVARFWSQRANYSQEKKSWVILGVTGPNEYENNVNNNWYTNYIARWCLQYAIEQINWVKDQYPAPWSKISSDVHYHEGESATWEEVANNMFFPKDDEREVFLQQDGFLDKELMTADQLPASQRPINQKWSWDRILRSCFIKQADVLQGMYFFEDHFDLETLRRHFDFYEPMTVHESSLSPCVHAILASRLGKMEKAYEMYLRTARLDLDDYNNDTEDGLHITSMAGTWMSVVRGFAGMTVRDGMLILSPVLPPDWKGLQFNIRFRDRVLLVDITSRGCDVTRKSGDPLFILVHKEGRHV
ncbi:MAG TPA: family 65 glycosyl hydrolase domain-containing protein [Saprospiraceae bacterium]|nr:family 65 glycosyl hydrolase domain-containing protein [Saprospiraceae bacterium]